MTILLFNNRSESSINLKRVTCICLFLHVTLRVLHEVSNPVTKGSFLTPNISVSSGRLYLGIRYQLPIGDHLDRLFSVCSYNSY